MMLLKINLPSRVCGAALLLSLLGGGVAGAQTPQHKRTVPALPNLSPLTVTPASPVPTQQPITGETSPTDTLLYNGQGEDDGVTAADWGGGAVADNTEHSLNNGHSLKVTTQGLYEGAHLNFNTPVDLSGVNHARTLVITLRFDAPAPTVDQGPGQFPGGPGGQFPGGQYPGGQPGQFPGGPGQFPGAQPQDYTGNVHSSLGIYNGGTAFQLVQRRGRGGGGGGRGGYGGRRNRGGGVGQGNGGFYDPNAVARYPVSNLRLAFTQSDGSQADILRPLGEPGDDGVTGWMDISVPMAALKFSSGAAETALKSLTIGGDGYAVFYVGQIKLVDDSTPITCFAGDNQNVAKGDVVTLHGTASGGESMLKYTWDFDSSDGITDEAEGQTVTTQYMTGDKDYTVTLTVSDLDGLKPPAKSTTVIHVNG